MRPHAQRLQTPERARRRSTIHFLGVELVGNARAIQAPLGEQRYRQDGGPLAGGKGRCVGNDLCPTPKDSEAAAFAPMPSGFCRTAQVLGGAQMKASQIGLATISLCFAAMGQAQTAATMPAGRTGQPDRRAMEVVGQDGRRSEISSSRPFTLDRGESLSGESLMDVARRRGYDVDAPTLRSLREWNPEVSSPTSPLRTGEQVRLIRPSEKVEPGSRLAVPPGAAPLTPLVFRTAGADIAAARKQVLESNTLSTQQLQQVDASAVKLQHANAEFEAKATSMTPRQRALATVQVDAATAQVRAAATSRGQADQAKAVQASAAIAADAEAFSKSLAGGPRKLKVLVRPSLPGKQAEPMAVYVLPLGLLHYGSVIEVSKLHNMLAVLTLPRPTSPSVGDVEPGIKYAVWIGPRHAVQQMAELVRKGGVSKYVPVNAKAATLLDVTFDEGDQTTLE